MPKAENAYRKFFYFFILLLVCKSGVFKKRKYCFIYIRRDCVQQLWILQYIQRAYIVKRLTCCDLRDFDLPISPCTYNALTISAIWLLSIPKFLFCKYSVHRRLFSGKSSWNRFYFLTNFCFCKKLFQIKKLFSFIKIFKQKLIIMKFFFNKIFFK